MFRVSSGKRGAALKVFIAGILALLMFSVIINSYVQLTEVYSSISEANAELNTLRSENVRMQTELEGKASISNIKDYAEQHLGLQKLDQSQIQYIDIQRIPWRSTEKSRTFLSGSSTSLRILWHISEADAHTMR